MARHSSSEKSHTRAGRKCRIERRTDSPVPPQARGVSSSSPRRHARKRRSLTKSSRSSRDEVEARRR
eukprot:3457118-Rhodomonas_salina.2